MRTLLAALLTLALMPLAQAAPDQPLSSRMDVYRIEIDADGRERAETAEEILPGELLEYRLNYENVSDAPLRALVITGPVPANTDYVGGSAATLVPSELVVSIDGGASFESEPVVRTRTAADGSTEEYVVAPEEYTHVRWRSSQSLAAGVTQEFRYRVVVE